MSIYSGFAKRQQESIYDKLIFKLISLLSNEVYAHKFNKPVTDLPQLSKKLLKIFKALTYMEKMKHLEPNMSNAFFTLGKALYYEHKNERSASQDSQGFIEGVSGMRCSDDLSVNGSEISVAASNSLFNKNLETINEKAPKPKVGQSANLKSHI